MQLPGLVTLDPPPSILILVGFPSLSVSLSLSLSLSLSPLSLSALSPLLQINSLITLLRETDLSFVRCVKPNTDKKAHVFDAQLVLNQLRYLGVMETVRIRRQGYPIRRTFKEIADMTRLLTSAPGSPDIPAGSTDKDVCRLMLNFALGTPGESGWQLGDNLVFLRDGKLEEIDELIRRLLGKKATLLQSKARAFVERIRYKKKERATLKIAAVVRSIAARKRVRGMRDDTARINAEAATRMAAAVRGRAARRELASQQAAALAVQTRTRALLARRELARRALRLQQQRETAAKRIQAFARGKEAMANYERDRAERRSRAALLMQQAIRARQARAAMATRREEYNTALEKAQKKAATSLQKAERARQARGAVRRRRVAFNTSALKVQSQWRMACERRGLSLLLAAAVKIQAWGRGVVALTVYNSIVAQRSQWTAFLEPNEAIVMSGLVRKAGRILKNQFALRGQLILTTLGRVLHVDIHKSKILLKFAHKAGDIACEAKSEKEFAVTAGGVVWNFTDMLGQAGRWPPAIAGMLGGRAIGDHIRIMLENKEHLNMTRQGYLVKRALKSGRNWRRR